MGATFRIVALEWVPHFALTHYCDQHDQHGWHLNWAALLSFVAA
jgi:hypothetical protein